MMRVYIILALRRQYRRTPERYESVILRHVSGNRMKGCVNYPTLKICKLKRDRMPAMKHVPELQDLVDDMSRFSDVLLAFAAKLQINLGEFHADHISVRCHQNTTADRWKSGLGKCGSLLNETLINGRPICLFTLDEPLTVGPLSIDLVELPYPGDKRYPHEGWEHIEIVLPGAEEELYTRALALIADEALMTPGIKLKQSAPKGDNERLPNPTLAVTDGSVTIKFHPHSLREIVASEREAG
jgi:predicted metalloenzyme YecM